MERTEDLGLNGMKIIQDDEKYCFTSDAVLLSHFAKVKKGDVVADFCSGSGIVGLHLFGLNFEKIKSVDLFEKQTPLYELSVSSVALNGLQSVFRAHNMRVQDITGFDGAFSLIVCNPPYLPTGTGEIQENPEIAICRREIDLTLSELILAISKKLKFGGRVAMVYRADRLCDVVFEMRKNKIEPKRLQFVSGVKKDPYLLLIEGVKGGKSGLKVLKTVEN